MQETIKTHRRISLVILPLLLIGLGCTEALKQASTDEVSEELPVELAKGPVKIASEHLPDLVRVHQRVISGGLPDGDDAFKELVDLGVKTIVSVDGMTPDAKTANKHGLRYVHLPHGYDGVPGQRVKELAKAVSDLESPVYIHCHHGKHRSPAAASVACVSAGLIPSELAVSILEVAGTDPNYKGLYESARKAKALDKTLIDELQVEFREVQEIPPMAEAMVQLSHAHDHLHLVAKAGWERPADHPDLEPVHEALLIRELYTELLRIGEVANQPEDFRRWLENSETAAKELETELATWNVAESATVPPKRFAELVKRITTNCKACHVKYRDAPLNEK